LGLAPACNATFVTGVRQSPREGVKAMECTTRCLWRNVIAAAALLVAALTAGSAAAQPAAGGASRQDIQRQERFNELQQLQVDTRLRANEDIPFNQRALIDFGGYVSVQYISLDDNQN